ncbi:branched-chain amino acid ABC transporter substrate-binding protein [Mesorhizobium sp. SP-1A]|uniref:branched-chain amino acid ABC transporter substrate-binding protein n=1 Tax=Mesorhizobium sp. SP-1A TaxID=3077840 RepID=UPI0028F6EFA8|nr:branched-chain amino acid ABC transporter substrate-binding protein [Mesorhizobium sp. SP-1A]
MRIIALSAVLALGLLCARTAAAETTAIGVAAPLSGSASLLGRQVAAGAKVAADAGGVQLTVADDACTANGGAAAARSFVDAKVKMVVGFLCTEAIEAALPILKDAGVPVITVGVRADGLTDRRDKTGWPVVRLAPRDDDERNAAAAILTRIWGDELFAIVDDGTIYGRDIAETVRAAAEHAGLKPVFVDTYRPDLDNQIGLVGRLRKAGATHVFVGGDGADVAIMTRDAQKLGADIVFAGGEALRTASGGTAYAAGTLMIAAPEWRDVADRGVLDAFAAAHVQPEGYALPAYAALEIAKAAGTSGKPLMQALDGQEFKTAIGPVRFDPKGNLTPNPYRLFRFDGARFVPTEGE